MKALFLSPFAGKVFKMSVKSKTYPLIGKVNFVKSRRARRFTLTVKPWRGVRITLPWHAAFRDAETFLLHHTGWVREKLHQAGLYEKAHRQAAIENKTAPSEEKLRELALAYLPGRTALLAERHGFTYRRITIRRSRTRWGSCSAVNNINLSIFLMQLPSHLIDYVILHELVHTVRKDHSSRFWELLEQHSGNARALAREIRKYSIGPRLPTIG
jgi:predicted metal-dependent hydrolase